tara:strand:+ start:610 stop:768 length:159 start_codon:yes stop_codon:yes gene_type:complete
LTAARRAFSFRLSLGLALVTGFKIGKLGCEYLKPPSNYVAKGCIKMLRVETD